ncbi:DUF3426 domain-containing protein [Herbaspirillum sp. YR522]|uniref:DUF3426 domain-containing protein n=1 Tax=Herbaspirillum sp. YR522 TaxID=1144342 RepID=UPI00026F53A3|nr:DUF3426 domain-containing protein [Herbaspirillum sp. YR522]EJN05042.1 hypothetical protein PMI40_02475 [Herbaspirillum sp. YR522]
MALATQCPQCLTIFRVANDQLKLRGGLVRCGSCKNVFNGNEYLVEAGISDGLYHPAPGSRALPPGIPPPAAPASIAMPATNASPGADALPVVNTPAPVEPPAPAPAPTPAPTPASVPPVVTEPIPLVQEPKVFRSPDSPGYIPDLGAPLPGVDALAPDDFPLPSKPSADDEPRRSPQDGAPDDTPADEPGTATDAQPEPEAEPAVLDDLDFVKKAERRARVGHVTQIAMILLAAVMVPLLLLQATYYWRNQIATGAPMLRPMLNGMCATFNCTVGVPAEIDQLSLESNELQVVPPNQNIYALSLLLRNRSTSAQAWPAIELTLNNDDEKPVVRRVFRPRDYLPGSAQIDNGIGAGSEQAVKLTFELDNALVSGYRIYLFYP